MDRLSPPPIEREVKRLGWELNMEQILNSNQSEEIEQLNLTVDTQREELAKAKEELQQERNKAERAVESMKYWQTESQRQSKVLDTLRADTDGVWRKHYNEMAELKTKENT